MLLGSLRFECGICRLSVCRLFTFRYVCSGSAEYGRQPVIDYLKSRPEPSITESSELAQQYLGLGEHDLAWASALKSAYQSYRQEFLAMCSIPLRFWTLVEVSLNQSARRQRHFSCKPQFDGRCQFCCQAIKQLGRRRGCNHCSPSGSGLLPDEPLRRSCQAMREDCAFGGE